jgi:hypothetical protein
VDTDFVLSKNYRLMAMKSTYVSGFENYTRSHFRKVGEEVVYDKSILIILKPLIITNNPKF